MVTRQSHNLKLVGSIPAPGTVGFLISFPKIPISIFSSIG